MPGLYSHTTRATGTILTATIYNGDHQNHIDNATPAQHDDYSANVAQMQIVTDPGEVGNESLATSTAGELERIRFAIKEMKGTDQWYETASTALGALSQPTFRNLILNGDMTVNQHAVTASTTHGEYFVESWNTSNTATARLTTQQSTANAAPGFPYSLLSTVTTAGSPAASDFHVHHQSLEGYFVRFLGWGAAGASSIVISLKVRSSVAGTYALAIRNGAVNRSYVTPLVINSPNVWEDKVFVIPGDTTGTWSTINTTAINISISMAVGSTYQTASSNVWQAGNFVGLTGMTQLTATNSATFQITAVQCEPGVIEAHKSPFERLPLDIQLIRSRRYYQTNYLYAVPIATSSSTADAWRGFAISGNDVVMLNSGFPVEMRTTPNVTIYHPVTGVISNLRRVNTGGSVGLSAGMSASARGMYSCQALSSLVTNELYDFMYTANCRI